MSEKKSRRKKEQTKLQEFKIIGETFYDNMLRVVGITIISTIIYIMFMPPIIFNWVISTGLDEDFYLTFPEIESNTDIYGISAFVIFFVIHVLMVRLFIQDNRVFGIAFFTALVILGLNLLIGQAIFGIIAFMEADSSVYSQFYIETLGLDILPGYQFNFDISFLNLMGMIILYDFALLIFILVLRKK